MHDLGLRPGTSYKAARVVGECFIRGALVSTPTGLRPIGPRRRRPVLDGHGKLQHVVGCYANPPGPLVEMTLEGGSRTITVTSGQLIRCLSEGNEQTCVRADDIEGRLVLTPGDGFTAPA